MIPHCSTILLVLIVIALAITIAAYFMETMAKDMKKKGFAIFSKILENKKAIAKSIREGKPIFKRLVCDHDWLHKRTVYNYDYSMGHPQLTSKAEIYHCTICGSFLQCIKGI